MKMANTGFPRVINWVVGISISSVLAVNAEEPQFDAEFLSYLAGLEFQGDDKPKEEQWIDPTAFAEDLEEMTESKLIGIKEGENTVSNQDEYHD